LRHEASASARGETRDESRRARRLSDGKRDNVPENVPENVTDDAMGEPADDNAAWRRRERARLLAARGSMSPEAFQAASGAILRGLSDILPPARGTTVGCYWPFRGEPDCIAYMRDVLRSGGEVALPVVVARGRPLEFRVWTEVSRMEAGAWGILHPAEGHPARPVALVLPLLGFDEAGYRLGYGAGYYDRTLASLSPRPFTVGVGFEAARLETIHPQPHDVPLDAIVTEHRKREFVRR